jgi:phosphoglycolate phosphatase
MIGSLVFCVLIVVPVSSFPHLMDAPPLRSCRHAVSPTQQQLASETDLKTVKAVIFDIDGTLADSWKLGFDATQKVLEKYGFDWITAECYHEHCIYSTPERLARHAGLVPGDEDFKGLGTKLAADFDMLYVGLVTLETASFYPQIHALLDNIPQSVVLGALTNAAVRYAYAVLECNCPVASRRDSTATPVFSRFRSIHGADSVAEPKPSAAGLLRVCDDLNVRPHDCVYIGDSPTDALAAENAGMTAIGVLWGSNSREKLRAAPFRHLCQSVKALQELLPQV